MENLRNTIIKHVEDMEEYQLHIVWGFISELFNLSAINTATEE